MTLLDNAYLMHHKDVGLIDATGGPWRSQSRL
jgi:hypothetical protein